MWYVYLVECSDNTLYCGITNDVDKRIQKHNKGAGAKYTRSRRPVTLRWTHKCDTKSEALQMEAFIKALTRPQKERLIEEY